MAISVETVSGGVTAPAGFRAHGVHAGIKASGALDLGLLVSERECTVGGVYTRNVLKGASLQTTMARVANGRARAVLVNSGNANACTGDQGHEDARVISAEAATRLGIDAEHVLPNSTGVIGVFLPVERITAALDGLVAGLTEDGHEAFARAMMTTDTRPKFSARRIDCGDAVFHIGGAVKGAGMIHPNMATMLVFMTTDAAIDAQTLQSLVSGAADTSFNRFTIDGDTSCDDTMLLMANGHAANAVISNDHPERLAVFRDALNDLCLELTYDLASDGEGVNHVVTVCVEGAPSRDAATTIARTIAISPLVKTAFYGCDPNWGRIINAAGYSGVEFDPERVDLHIAGVQMMSAGKPTGFDESVVHDRMKQPRYEITLNLNQGEGHDFYITTDFSNDYVNINADYRNRT